MTLSPKPISNDNTALIDCHRRGWLKLSLSILTVLVCRPATAQTLSRGQVLKGWDLTYQRLIRERQIKPPDFLIVWTQRIQERFAPGLLLEFEGNPLVAGFLVEHAVDGHAGDPTGFWAGRTSSRAFVQHFTLGRRSRPVEPVRELDTALFDQTVEALMNWTPTKLPRPPGNLDPHSQDVIRYSHVGVTSVFRGDTSRQWPITLSDVLVVSSSKPAEPEYGRLMKLLVKLLPPEPPRADPAPAEAARLAALDRRLQESASLVVAARLESLDGTSSISLNERRGQVLVVSLIATWCDPCKDWARVLTRLQEDFAGRNVAVFAISSEHAKEVQVFKPQHAPRIEILISPAKDDLFFRAQTSSIPTTYVIDADGKPYGPFGANSQPELQALLTRIAR